MIDLELPLTENLENIAKALGKTLDTLVVTTLAKPRRDQVIADMQAMGVRVFAVPDGVLLLLSVACQTAKST